MPLASWLPSALTGAAGIADDAHAPLSSLPGAPSFPSASGGTLSPASGRNASARGWSNWAGTVRFAPSYFHTPRNEGDIRAVLSYAVAQGHRVRVVGCGHSPGAIVDGSDVPANRKRGGEGTASASGASAGAGVPVHLLALAVHFNRLLSVDVAAQRVTVEAGMSLAALNAALDEQGLALSSLGSISDQTIGGALACGTHGSSTGAHALLSAYVVELELLDASGKVWRCNASENRDLFDAARVSLGALGVVLRVTLQCERAYDLLERSCAIRFDELVDETLFRRMVLEDPEADFVRFHWIPHTDTVVYTRMAKRYQRDGAGHERDFDARAKKLAKASALEAYLHRLREWKERMVGFHMLQSLYWVSTLPGMDRPLVPRIAKWYTKLVFPPEAGPFPVSAAATAATAVAATVSPSAANNPATTAAVLAAAGPAASSSSPSAASSSLSLPSALPSFTRLDRHDRILNFDCLFAQYVTEWAAELSEVGRALKAIRRHIEQTDLRVHFPIEIRFSGGSQPRPRVGASAASVGTAGISEDGVVSGDGIWLSPAYARPCAWIGIIMYRPFGKPVPFEDYFGAIERILNDTPASNSGSSGNAVTAFQGKPHWAKNVVMPLRSIPFAERYPRWNDFKAVRERIDPTHTFSNELVHRLFDDEDKEKKAQRPVQQSNPPLPSAL